MPMRRTPNLEAQFFKDPIAFSDASYRKHQNSDYLADLCVECIKETMTQIFDIP